MYKVSNYKENTDFSIDVEFCAYASRPLRYTINSKTKLQLLTTLGNHTLEYLRLTYCDFWFCMNQYHKVWTNELRTQTMIRFWQVCELKDKLRDKTCMQQCELILQNLELFQYFCDLISESQYSFQMMRNDLERVAKVLIQLDKRQNDEYLSTLQTVMQLAS